MNRKCWTKLMIIICAMALLPWQSIAAVRAQTTTPILFEDERFFEEPDFTLSDLRELLKAQGGNLADAPVTCGGNKCTAAEAIYYAGNTFRYSLNVKLLVTLIEMRSGLVTHKISSAAQIEAPLALTSTLGFETQLAYVGDALVQAYHAYKPGAVIQFTEGSPYIVSSEVNAATYAILVVLAQLVPDRATWDLQVLPVNGLFATTLAKFDVKGPVPARPAQQFPGDGDPAFLYQPYQGNAVGYTAYFDHDRTTSNVVIYTGATGYPYNNHDAYDYGSNGRNVVAAADGIVDLVYINYSEPNHQNWCEAYGYPYSPVNAMIVKHDPDGDGTYELQTRYWHMASIGNNPATGRTWAVGDTISRSAIIGPTGSTGCSTGPHLHFAVRQSGRVFDPNGWAGSYADPWEPNFWLWANSNASYAAETMFIDNPGADAHVVGNINLAGWAINRKYGPNTGVDRVVVYLDGEARTGTYLGEAVYGDERTDVGTAYGDSRFNNSGWHLNWNTASVSPGTHTIYVYAHSVQKNNWFFHQRTFIVDADTSAPTIAVTQQPATGQWYNTDQTIVFTISDAGSGVRGYKVAWDQNPPGGSEIAGASGSVNLSGAGQGQHTLYIQAWDNVGNASTVTAIGWFGYDTVAPAAPTTAAAGCAAQSNVWQNSCADPSFTFSGASDATSGIAGYQLYWGSDPNGTSDYWTGSAAFDPGAPGEGTYYFRARAKDNAGHWSGWVTLFTFRYDATAPTGAVTINQNASVTYATLVRLFPSGSDALSGLAEVRFRDAGGAWSNWVSLGTTLWQLPGPTGQTFSVEMQVRDRAGNESAVYADTIALNIYPARPASGGYRLTRSTWGAAAVERASARYRLLSTLGQPSLIGSLTSSSYRLTSGYWAGYRPVQRVYLPLVLRNR